jgi:NAD(P)-dependent dehydrogenase (short-subunit alcohol dehydrogenase family)
MVNSRITPNMATTDMAKRFQGQAFLVTGGNSGIGYAICERLIADGAKVMVHGMTLADARAAAKALGRGAKAVGGDLRNPKTSERIVGATVKAFGRIDGLANNAGIYPRHSIEQTDEAVFDLLFHINTRAPLLCAKAAIAAFRAQQSAGSIVTIGSINGWMGLSELVVYSMSKGALMTMTRNLANTLASEHIRLTCLNVGWTATENENRTQLSEGRPLDWMSKLPKSSAPTGKLLAPSEIAAHVCFWLSRDSAPATGQIYEVEQFPIIGRLNTQEM